MSPFLRISPGLSVVVDRLEHMFDTAVAWAHDARTGSAEEPPGLVLAARLDATDVGSLDDGDVLELVAGWERLAGWVRARQADAVAVLAGRPSQNPTWPGAAGVSARQRTYGLAPDELLLRLGVTRRRAERMVRLARGGEAHLSDTVDALRAGTVDEAKAHLIVEALEHTTIPVALEVQDRVLPRAGSRTLSQLSGDLRAALIDVDLRDAACRHAAATTDRRVCRPRVLPDGMASLYAVLPAADAVAIDHALHGTARAAAAAGDARTIDQLRADALLDAVLCHSVGRLERSAPRRGPTVHITVPLSLLSGDDTVAATLSGYGAITPDQARRIAADPHSTWRRLLTDPASGRIVDYGRTRYRTPAELAEVIRLRDGTCVMPTCNAAAASCDLDHTIPFASGGSTSEGNLGALCRHHHLLKTHGGWGLEQPKIGAFVWTTPAGQVIRTADTAGGERRRRKRQRCGRRGHRDRHGPTAVLRGHTATGRASESR